MRIANEKLDKARCEIKFYRTATSLVVGAKIACPPIIFFGAGSVPIRTLRRHSCLPYRRHSCRQGAGISTRDKSRRRSAGWKTCDTADKNVCATIRAFKARHLRFFVRGGQSSNRIFLIIRPNYLASRSRLQPLHRACRSRRRRAGNRIARRLDDRRLRRARLADHIRIHLHREMVDVDVHRAIGRGG